MHYANGQEAKAGDLVVKRELYKAGEIEVGSETIGILCGAQSQSTTCNGTLVPVAKRLKSELGFGPWLPIHGQEWSATLSQCMPVDPSSLFAAPTST
ncbi:MAG: hypothetical protein LAO20_16820 [Acidobacteriia bacterium]|nr:hypothetical protein [Terriglobia bacterium]